MTDTSNVTVSEPPVPAETVAPNDPFISRAIVMIVGLTLLVIVVGAVYLAAFEKSTPDWMENVAMVIVGGLIQATVTRTSASTSTGILRRRDRGDVDAYVLLFVVLFVLVLFLYFDIYVKN